MLKIINTINEALTLKSTLDRYNQKRIIIVSDNPDPKQASNETFKTKDIFKQAGAHWDPAEKHWYWNDRFKTADEIAVIADKAVRDANQLLGQDVSGGKEITKFDDVEVLVQVKEFIEGVKSTYIAVKAAGGKVTESVVENYIQELSDALDDQKLLDDIAAFNRVTKMYLLETGKYSYTFNNLFLIWLQLRARKSKAKEFGSAPYWLGRGYEPKPDAEPLFISKPVFYEKDLNRLATVVDGIIKKHPNSPKEFAKEISFQISNPKNPIPKEKHNAFWNWAMTKGYAKKATPKGYKDVPIYDNLNVQPIPGVEQINAPEPPKWYGDDDSEDDKSAAIINALKAFCVDNNIKVDDTEDLGGARGVSKGGHIQLLTNSIGAGLLATFVHEIAHELLHQPANKNLGGGKFFVGRVSSKEAELHAESVAYIVMKSYDFPIKHSINYLALWKQKGEDVKRYSKLLRTASMFIIQQIEKYATKLSSEKEETVSDISESVSLIKNMINEFKTLIKK